MHLNDADIMDIVQFEESQCIGFSGDSTINDQRAKLINYYNQKPYGDEQDGLSSIVTAEVFLVVESIKSHIMPRCENRNDLCLFTSSSSEHDEEAKQKTDYANFLFSKENNEKNIVRHMLTDGLLGFTGWVKVYQDKAITKHKIELYKDISEEELQLAKSVFKTAKNKDFTIEENGDGTFNLSVFQVTAKNTQKIKNIPPEECVVSANASNFSDADFIGQRSIVFRSDLYAMGFDKKAVDSLNHAYHASVGDQAVKDARSDFSNAFYGSVSTSSDASRDKVELCEYYVKMDIDQDGIIELVQVFKSGDTLLSYEVVPFHPYFVYVPIPVPHRAIGKCPAETASQFQLWKSVLVRQMNNNIYATNFRRIIANEAVDKNDLINTSPGGVIRIDGLNTPQACVQPLVVSNQVLDILSVINYADSMIEKITAVTAYNQGTDAESLNKTLGGFQGIRDLSMQRIEDYAKELQKTLTAIFERIVLLASKYQKDSVVFTHNFQKLSFNPSEWVDEFAACNIDIGTGQGTRQETFANLISLLQFQKTEYSEGSPLVDPSKIWNTYHRIIQSVGLKETSMFFNNPEIEHEIIVGKFAQLEKENEALKAQISNPLAEAEKIKSEYRLVEMDRKLENDKILKTLDIESKMAIHDDKMAMESTKAELQFSKNVPDSKV